MVGVVMGCTLKYRDILGNPSYRCLWTIWPTAQWHNPIRITLKHLKYDILLYIQFVTSSLKIRSSKNRVNNHLLLELMQIQIVGKIQTFWQYTQKQFAMIVHALLLWSILIPLLSEQTVKNIQVSTRHLSVNAACFSFYTSTPTAAHSTKASRKKGIFLDCRLLSLNATTTTEYPQEGRQAAWRWVCFPPSLKCPTKPTDSKVSLLITWRQKKDAVIQIFSLPGFPGIPRLLPTETLQ